MAKRNKKTKIAAPIKSLRGQERAYQRQLNKLGKALIVAVRKDVLPYLKSSQSEYTIDGYTESVVLKYLTDSDYDYMIPNLLDVSRKNLTDSDLTDGIGSQLGVIFNSLSETFTGPLVTGFAQVTSVEMVTKVSKINKGKFDRSVQRAIGVDLGGIIATEGLDDFVQLSVNKNIGLIENLSEEYLKQIETIVNNGVVSGLRYSEIEKQIVGRTGTANSKLAERIKLIATNEIQTINSQITLRRSQALGITEGIWRTSEDERVRGNPSGKYPNAKPSHFKLNGKPFNLKKGMKTETGEHIWPGQPIRCRCSYSPVIEVDNA